MACFSYIINELAFYCYYSRTSHFLLKIEFIEPPYNDAQFHTAENISQAFGVLGIPIGTDYSKVRKAYLKLQMKYHPDRLIAQGFSNEIKREYEARSKTITAAYNLLEQHLKKHGAKQ